MGTNPFSPGTVRLAAPGRLSSVGLWGPVAAEVTLRPEIGKLLGQETRTALVETVGVFSALCHPIRLGILVRIAEQGPKTSTELAVGTGLTRQAIFKHVKVLLRAGLVRGTRVGKEREFELETQRLYSALTYLHQMFASGFVPSSDRLRQVKRKIE
ncbi:MAG: helix-turn-helix domain-containing protein [Thermoplasmata archaeon]